MTNLIAAAHRYSMFHPIQRFASSCLERKTITIRDHEDERISNMEIVTLQGVKKFFFIIIAILGVKLSQSQTVVQLPDISNHIGDSVKVEGKVYSTRYLADSKGSPTLINIGAAYPNQLLTVVIYGDDRKNFTSSPEFFKDKEVVVTGKVESYRGKPQIIVHDSSQIEVRQPVEEIKK
jgi:DNA/RNA endonuclease YhcR with UshA esterase domain